jgi:hypothetical protein
LKYPSVLLGQSENRKTKKWSMRCFYHLRLVGVSGFNFPIIQWNMKIWILNRMDGISDDFKIFNGISNGLPMVFTIEIFFWMELRIGILASAQLRMA